MFITVKSNWNGNVNYRDSLFVIFNSRELYEEPNLTAPLKGIVLVSSFLSNLD